MGLRLPLGITGFATRRLDLAESEARIRAILDSALDCVITIDHTGRIREFNPAAELTFGYRREEILGRDLAETIIPPALRESHRRGFGRYLATGEARILGTRLEITAMHADGREFPVELGLTRVERPGDPLFTAYLRDITERKLAEERLLDLFENAKDVISTADMDDRLTSANAAFVRLSGYTRQELLGKNISCVFTDESLARAAEMGERKLAGETDATTYDMVLVTKDGRHVPIEMSTRLIVEGGATVGTQAIGRDLTERNRLEEQLRQSQKLDAIGQLVGGVAHDFNNRLQAIAGHVELAQKGLGRDPDQVRRHLNEIERATSGAAALTQQLLAYSRKQMLRPQTIEVNKIVESAQGLLRPLIPANMRFELALDRDLPPVYVDPALVEEALVNLALNARDAMTTGDLLKIETRRVERNGLPAVALVVTDTGCGMNPETRIRAFEPFFTTKELGKGTGLGLSSVHGTVHQSGGEIALDSVAGEGTRVTLTFPAKIGLAPAETPLSAGGRQGDGELVLLAEDEPSVRAILSEALEEWNYRVLAAGDGAAALRLAAQHIDELALLVTDGVMPELNGAELIAAVKRLRPDLPALYISGYSQRLDPEGADNVLQKPFALDEFAATIRTILDQTLAAHGSAAV